MTDEQNTLDDELEGVTIEDESPAVDSDTEEGEQVEEQVEPTLEDVVVDTKRSTAEEEAQKQVDSWYSRILSGEKELKDAPKWLQTRLSQKLDVVSKTPDIEEIVTRKLQEQRDEQEFTQKKASLPKMSRQDAAELNRLYKEYRPLGKAKALDTAIRLLGLSEDVQQAEKRGIAKAKMSLPTGGVGVKRKTQNIVDLVEDDKAFLNALRN